MISLYLSSCVVAVISVPSVGHSHLRRLSAVRTWLQWCPGVPTCSPAALWDASEVRLAELDDLRSFWKSFCRLSSAEKKRKEFECLIWNYRAEHNYLLMVESIASNIPLVNVCTWFEKELAGSCQNEETWYTSVSQCGDDAIDHCLLIASGADTTTDRCSNSFEPLWLLGRKIDPFVTRDSVYSSLALRGTTHTSTVGQVF